MIAESAVRRKLISSNSYGSVDDDAGKNGE